MMSVRQRPQGFTLIEILIAITVTAIIGIGTATLLSQTIRVSETLEVRGGQLRALQLADSVISRDFEQILTRPVRDTFGDLEPALSTTAPGYDIEFTRSGWRDPRELLQNLKDFGELARRSELQRVAYALEEEELIRYYWPVLDKPQDIQPLRQVMLPNVTGFSLRLLDEKNEWQEDWPTAEQLGTTSAALTAVPRLVELSINHRLYGKLIRLFAIAGWKQPKMPQNAGQQAQPENGDPADNENGNVDDNQNNPGGSGDGGNSGSGEPVPGNSDLQEFGAPSVQGTDNDTGGTLDE